LSDKVKEKIVKMCNLGVGGVFQAAIPPKFDVYCVMFSPQVYPGGFYDGYFVLRCLLLVAS
ncbi:MAG: hypothetical protein KAS69_06600, partial [Planctomycetes bacterium]|nr:hypothetical protein [Planctomycetota bacterium]